jgi:hypothetical protein
MVLDEASRQICQSPLSDMMSDTERDSGNYLHSLNRKKACVKMMFLLQLNSLITSERAAADMSMGNFCDRSCSLAVVICLNIKSISPVAQHTALHPLRLQRHF